ncbi:PAS domain-containing hybrid sensor histidine kinase/response regulator [Erythrobacter sp.]|uniref:PAS domain-containing hybrid sensor histidine kinase/response regulator n=1 Tax=Erythrobacter sp. TaxID=1042 RepID=UPI001425F214|nr:PAS domain-containing hybrid sensor histidine kinase/response regulator [Erythrobacter sp.]QIQ87804.1 MAG: response regulator [Erythrobacter sp.]
MPASTQRRLGVERSEEGLELSLDEIVRHAFQRFRPDAIVVTRPDDTGEQRAVSYFHCIDQANAATQLADHAASVAEIAARSDQSIRGRVEAGAARSGLPERPLNDVNPPFYMAMPIKSASTGILGVFCVLSSKRQRWSQQRLDELEFFVRACSNCIDLNNIIDKSEKITDDNPDIYRKLIIAERKFNDLARNVPGAIFEYIMRPGVPDRIEFMSPGCFDIWGYTSEEIEFDPTLLWQAVFDEDLPDMQASVQRSAEELTRWQHRWRIRTKSGLIKWLQSYGTPFRLDDGGTCWNTLILDVSVEQNAQLALAENTRLIHEAQKIHSIGRVAGGVAHDFNNILAVISGNAESIDTDKLSREDREAVKEIVLASNRGAELTKQLLGFARRSELKPKALNLSSVISSIGSMLRRVLPANISLETALTAGLWTANIDRGLLENALLNLVINARDAMPEGGALTIETANVRISDDYVEARQEEIPPGRYVMVAVTDTGTGIAEELLPQLFEPFVTTKGPNEGTGLGLAMVDGFVRQSGGAARIYSELGHGTSVKLYFPATSDMPHEESQSNRKASGSASAAVRILLVEDQEAVRRIVEKMLSSAGYTVVAVGRADEAWDVFEKAPSEFDVVVTDIVMPGKLQGPQLVKAIRAIRRDIPALFMSGYPHEANVHGNGVRDTDISLMKPIRRGELLTAVDRLVRLI